MSHANHGTPRRRMITSVALGFALLSGSANAVPVTYNFVAEVTLLNNVLVEGGPTPNVSLGDTVTGSFTYEAGIPMDPGFNTNRQQLIDFGFTPVAAGDPLPGDGSSAFHDGMVDGVSETGQAIGGAGFGGTDPVFEISFNFDAVSATVAGDTVIRHRTNEWVATPDRPSFAYDTMIAFAGLEDPNGFSSGVRLMDDGVYTGTFPLDSTLASLPGLDELFLARVFGVLDFDGDGEKDTQFFAAITSLTRAVPAPGAFVLLLLGLMGLRLGARRA